MSPDAVQSSNDKFGTNLPAGANVRDVVGLIAPDRESSTATLVGMKRWPHRNGSYVAIVSFPAEEDDTNAYPATPAYLGLVELAGENATMKLIAHSGGPLDVVATVDPESREHWFDGFKRFDFAPYKIKEKEVAFGIRFLMHTMYAGGGSQTEYLALFRIEGDKITNILTEPISSQSDIAGDWHDDGTRDHQSNESFYVLSVMKHTTNGYNDLRIAEKGGRSRRTFVWSNDTNKYVDQEVGRTQPKH